MIKKILPVVALFAVTAPAAHAEIDLGLGGYFFGYAGYVDQDNNALREFDIKRKSKVFFKGSNKFDNGVTVGFYSELFQEDGTDNISASYAYGEGNWGNVKLGDERGAPFQLQVAAPGVDKIIDGRDIHISFISTAGLSVDRDYRQSGLSSVFAYSTKVTYLTPIVNGFRAGISFAPEVRRVRTANYEDGMAPDNDAGAFGDYTEAALRYDGKAGDVSYSIGGGYSMAKIEANGSGLNDDFNEWNTGLSLSYAGVTLGGAYNADNGADSTDGDTDNMAVGIAYDWDAYHLGTNYFISDSGDDDQFKRWTFGGGYQYGPGMRFNTVVGLFDIQDAGADLNDGTFVTVGTDIRF